ncbi:zinc-ribbon domain-containing protein [Novosphingobium sp. M1R2S20]|uniref:Zinc-ribbon domain-containing protein n=1 Tax=Novosphingobium rhizovicinum TaxID=3228928 RepID=A0ABV3RAF3_9SPHN
MIIACPACATRYAVPDSAIGVDGRTVRCAKCRHSWFQEGPEAALAEAGAASDEAASATAAPPATADMAPRQEPPSPRAADIAEPAAGTGTRGRDKPSASEAPAPERDPPPPSPGKYYDDTAGGHFSDEGPSRFDFAPPFRPRRNWAKIGMMGAVVFAVITLSLAALVAWAGLPDWVPVARPTFAQAQQDLVLDFPAKRQDRRTLPNGTEYFGASGTVTNIGGESRYVPTILIVLRDARDRIVYSWEVVPPKRELAPGEAVTINEAVTDVPKAAKSAEIGWKPN